MEKLLSVEESFYSLYASVHIFKFHYMQELTLLKHWTCVMLDINMIYRNGGELEKKSFGLLTVGASASVTKQDDDGEYDDKDSLA